MCPYISVTTQITQALLGLTNALWLSGLTVLKQQQQKNPFICNGESPQSCSEMCSQQIWDPREPRLIITYIFVKAF